jgi:formylglycine-generating enzyme required for sulfatase activity
LINTFTKGIQMSEKLHEALAFGEVPGAPMTVFAEEVTGELLEKNRNVDEAIDVGVERIGAFIAKNVKVVDAASMAAAKRYARHALDGGMPSLERVRLTLDDVLSGVLYGLIGSASLLFLLNLAYVAHPDVVGRHLGLGMWVLGGVAGLLAVNGVRNRYLSTAQEARRARMVLLSVVSRATRLAAERYLRARAVVRTEQIADDRISVEPWTPRDTALEFKETPRAVRKSVVLRSSIVPQLAVAVPIVVLLAVLQLSGSGLRGGPGDRRVSGSGQVYLKVTGEGDEFWAGACEVTLGEFSEFIASGSPGLKDMQVLLKQENKNEPVLVSAEQAAAFAVWKTAKDRKAGILSPNEVYSLPTDHQWSLIAGEAKGTGKTPEERGKQAAAGFVWGDKWPSVQRFANTGVDKKEEERALSPVGSTDPVRGFYDLAGNAAEWTRTPLNHDGKQEKQLAVRGGSFKESAQADFHIGRRRSVGRDENPGDVGFRLVIVSIAPLVAENGK